MAAREQLIASTQELLWERGYVGMSPKAIQRRAGVGQGSMYHHFEGKPDLAAVAVRRSADGLRADVEAVLDSPGSALERISAYLTRDREVLRGCRVGGLTQDPEIIADDALREPLGDTFTWLRRRLCDLIARDQARGDLARTVAPEQLASMVCAVLQGGYVIARARQSAEPFQEAVTGVAAMLAILATPTAGGTQGQENPA